MTRLAEFKPNWVSSPGETISDVLREQDISLNTFSKRIGCSLRETEDLLEGKYPITLGLARKIEAAIGSSVEFWISRDFNYRQAVTRQSDVQVRDWIAELPIREMVRFGWMKPSKPSHELESCLRFFDVPDLSAWKSKYSSVLYSTALRTSIAFESTPGAVAAWLRQGEIEARKLSCGSWNPHKFQTALVKVRRLTRQKDPERFLPAVRSLCADAGVATVIVRAPSGCRASGATRFLSRERAVLQLSFRYLSDDHFWFTFFHEAGHLILHGTDGFFLEGIGSPATQQEQEANYFAERTLIPSNKADEMLSLPCNSRAVIRFAADIGVSPGIVVGQLQHHNRIKRSHLNGLKRRFVWDE